MKGGMERGRQGGRKWNVEGEGEREGCRQTELGREITSVFLLLATDSPPAKLATLAVLWTCCQLSF